MPRVTTELESGEEQHEVSTYNEGQEEGKEDLNVEEKMLNDIERQNESEEKIFSLETTEAKSHQGHEEDLPSTCNASEEEKNIRTEVPSTSNASEEEKNIRGEVPSTSNAPEEEKNIKEESPKNIFSMKQSLDDEEYGIDIDPEIRAQLDYIKTHDPKTDLEKAYVNDIRRKDAHIERLTAEITKLKNFISKRKQTYKRKRKDSGAPTRALSAYNIFVQERFKRLSKENEVALKSTDTDAQMKRVPPASLVASTGSQWKELGAEDKQYYEEKARADRKRHEEEMSSYRPPAKPGSRKRSKTGYNMFFSQHVLRLKQKENGIPSERGSVARLVGSAWKELSHEDKQFYEREADVNNQENPIEKSTEGKIKEEGGRSKTPKAVNAPPPAQNIAPETMAQPNASAGVYHSEYAMQHQPMTAGQTGAQSEYGRGDLYNQYAMYGSQHAPPPSQTYGGYPAHSGQIDPYAYAQHYGYSQHGYGGHYGEGANPGV